MAVIQLACLCIGAGDELYSRAVWRYAPMAARRLGGRPQIPKSPLFIAQGAKDPRVNKAESDQMVEALKKRGVVVEYMVKDNEGHGFANEENRFEFYEAMEKFLATNLKK